jgi:hypothetical protein
MILYLAADLIWATRIKATATDLGIAARPVRSLEMLEARLADSPVAAVVLDLEAPDEALSMIQRLRGVQAADRERRIRIVCWAPHVEVDLMKQAKEAGADEVMPRGAFDHNLSGILTALADTPS